VPQGKGQNTAIFLGISKYGLSRYVESPSIDLEQNAERHKARLKNSTVVLSLKIPENQGFWS